MTAHSLSPRKARQDFLISKYQSLKESSARAYEYPTKHFVEFCEKDGIEAVEEINGYLIERWEFERQEEDLAPATIHNDVKKVRVFIRWCESMGLLEGNVADGIEVPEMSEHDVVADEKIGPEQMESVLGYLEKYEYATRLHALLVTMWYTGCRISGALALDVDDIEAVEGYLSFRDRPEQDTPLKNGFHSERNVGVPSEVIDVVSDYVDARREPITDEHGREPLFTTKVQRLTRNRAYKDTVAITRPCKYSDNCPHNRDVSDCDAALRKKQAAQCPSSRSMHPIRRGSITWHLNSGWPAEQVSTRCDVGTEVLKKHYDSRTHEDKRQKRDKHLDKLK